MINEQDFLRQMFRCLLSQKQFLLEFYPLLEQLTVPSLLRQLVDNVKKVLKDKKHSSQ